MVHAAAPVQAKFPFKKRLWEFSCSALVKDLALSLQQLGWLLWCRFSPWSQNFHMPWVQPKKKKDFSQQLAVYNTGGGEQGAHGGWTYGISLMQLSTYCGIDSLQTSVLNLLFYR